MTNFTFITAISSLFYPFLVVNGHRYFLTLVDDCSRFTWNFLLKQKSNVANIIPKFFYLINTRFKGRIKTFRSDNAQELEFKDFFNSQGVLHQYSCVDTPQSNSFVERKHQHLLNVDKHCI